VLYGDNNSRSCITSCVNNATLTQYADPTTRVCVSQCPNASSYNYYGYLSTGSPTCIIVCPTVPILFGYNVTNLCISQCITPTYGDQTGGRTCLNVCPIVASVMYYAQ
jgi:hypothetical protein